MYKATCPAAHARLCREGRRACTGALDVAVGCAITLERLRVVRAECMAARTTVPSVLPTGHDLAHRTLTVSRAVRELLRPLSPTQLVHYFFYPL